MTKVLTEHETTYNLGWDYGFHCKFPADEEGFHLNLAFLRGFYDGSKMRKGVAQRSNEAGFAEGYDVGFAEGYDAGYDDS